MVEIEIDGRKVEVQEGSMVMDAANKIGSYIPHFCYHKKLSIAANCRMCLVEVEKAPKPLPACATPVTAGMIVRTNSEKAVTAQKGVMEFLLINHPLDCPICDQGGECQLQDLAVGYGKSSSRYEEEKRVVVPKDVGPLISMKEMSRCIHCTRCVRFGQEVAGVMELGMLNRGEHSEITTFVGKTVDSELSGNMIDLCPVGALLSKPFRYSARTWELSRRKSVSPHDGLGSNLIVQVKGGKVMRVLPFENDAVNECWLSDRDRFSYEGLNAPDRLTQPMIKQDGKWIGVDWQTALDYVAHGLSNIKHEHGPDAIAALAAPHSTLEELHLLQKLVRGLGSDNIDFRLRQTNFALDGKVVPWLGMSIAEIGHLDQVFIIGSSLRKDHPLIAAKLRQSAKRGAKIGLLHAVHEDPLMPLSHHTVDAPSKWLPFLHEVLVAVSGRLEKSTPAGLENIQASDRAQQLGELLVSGKARAVFLGNTAVYHPDAALLHAAAQQLAEMTGATLGYLTDSANTVGGYIANALPQTGANALEQAAQPRKAYLLMHLEPGYDHQNPVALNKALNQAEMVISLSSYQDGLDYADVMLPISPFTETSGTFVNCEGRAQSFNGAVKPLGDTRPAWKVLRVMGNLLGLDGFQYETSEEIRNEVLGAGSTSEAGLTHLLNNYANGNVLAGALSLRPAELERLADIPAYAGDPISRRSSPLQQTVHAKRPAAGISVALSSKLGIKDGEQIKITQGSQSVIVPCGVESNLPDNIVRIASAHASTALLGSMFGHVTVERV